MIVTVNERDEVRPNLWLGAMPKYIDDFKYVICLAEAPQYFIRKGQRVICQPFDDSPEMPDEGMLHDLAEMVLSCSKKGPTLVHCTAGLNRSGLVVALALVKEGLTPFEAIDLLREKRDQSVLYNTVFEEWLWQQGNNPLATPDNTV